MFSKTCIWCVEVGEVSHPEAETDLVKQLAPSIECHATTVDLTRLY